MKILVTGATGVYGRSVVERLDRAGHEVVAMARNPPKALPPGVRFSQGDVADQDAVLRAMDGCEVVAHLAFVVSPLKSEEETRRINLGGTQNVLDAMQATGARRLVFVSSAMSYGANPDNPPLFTEEHEQRPAPDYIYGTCKKEAERLIRESGVEAVIARTAVTVGRNIDNLLVDIFAAPAIVGIKGVDIRYQLVHQDDVGRFVALACEQGPPGPVNVAPADFLELRRIAEILGKRYVEVSEAAALKGIEFMWEHDLADITPGEAAGISYLPRMATDRLRDEWDFHCAWTTAEAVLDLRRAVTGIVAVAKRRIELPWSLRFPTQRPGEIVSTDATARPQAVAQPGELDTPAPLRHPTYTSLTAARAPLPALTLTTQAYLLRAAATGVLDAFGAPADQRRTLGGVAAGIFAHRLYVNDDVQAAIAATASRRRRIVAASYAREVRARAAWASDTLAGASELASKRDEQLDATMSALRDELAWFWAMAAVGLALDGEPLTELQALVTALPATAALAAAGGYRPPRAGGRHAVARAQAERTAIAVGQALAAAVYERAQRLVAAGVLADPEDVAHLTWDELLAPPDADLGAIAERRRSGHARMDEQPPPSTISVTGAGGAMTTTEMPRREAITG